MWRRCALVAMGLSLMACFEGSDAGVAPGRSVRPSGDTTATTAGAQPGWADRARSVVPTSSEQTGVLQVSASGASDLLTGDLSCIGHNLPAEPSGAPRTLRGRTVYFATTTAAPGTLVRLIDAKGDEMMETESDDAGRFELLFDDTPQSQLALIELSQPGFLPVRHTSTHPERAWADDVDLGIAQEDQIQLLEGTAGVTIDQARGAVFGQVFDCQGVAAVAGVTVAVEGENAPVYYGTGDYELSAEQGATSSSSQFWVFNLAPGTHSLALWGFTQPDQQRPVLINRLLVAVSAGTLTAVSIYPE